MAWLSTAKEKGQDRERPCTRGRKIERFFFLSSRSANPTGLLNLEA